MPSVAPGKPPPRAAGHHARAIVFSVDEKTKIEALDRTQTMLPQGQGKSSAMLTTTSTTSGPACLPPLRSGRAR
jgi:hypothetical protein